MQTKPLIGNKIKWGRRRIDPPGLEKIQRMRAQRSSTKGMAWTAFSANLARFFSFLADSESGSYSGSSSAPTWDSALRAVGTFDDGDDDE